MIDRLGTGMLAQWLRHEVLANNLANASTPGFKRDDLVFEVPVPVMSALVGGRPLALPGARIQAPWTDFSPGPIQPTGRGLDVALGGPGFLVVDTPAGPRYTRHGALAVDPEGYLALTTGERVRGERGPIQVGGSDPTIGEDGVVLADRRVVDRLQVVDFPRPYRLVKLGGNLFGPAGADLEPEPATGAVITPGALEAANVGAVHAMVGMIELHRTFEAYQRAIQAIDETDRQAASEIGRV